MPEPLSLREQVKEELRKGYVRFFDETKDSVCVQAKVNEAAMIQFAKNYAPDVMILEPAALREQIKEELKRNYQAYC